MENPLGPACQCLCAAFFILSSTYRYTCCPACPLFEVIGQLAPFHLLPQLFTVVHRAHRIHFSPSSVVRIACIARSSFFFSLTPSRLQAQCRPPESSSTV